MTDRSDTQTGAGAGITSGAGMGAAHGKQRVGVLLVNTGSPDAPTPPAVRAFLKDMLSDKLLIHNVNWFLWKCILHLFILPRRGVTSAERYKKIWTEQGSPLIDAMSSLCQQLSVRLSMSNTQCSFAMGMNYGNPSIQSALEQLQAAQVNKLVVLPLYPQHAFSTTKSSYLRVQAALKALNWNCTWTYIDNYHNDSAYISALAQSIRDAGFSKQQNDRLVFSFHSIPVPDVEAGDPYQKQTQETARAVATALNLAPEQWNLCYQSKFSKYCEWLTPSTHDTIIRLAQQGHKRVFFICPGFAVDCLETRYDVFYDIKPTFDEHAAPGEDGKARTFIYVPCLGKSALQCDVLAHVLAPYIDAHDAPGAKASAQEHTPPETR